MDDPTERIAAIEEALSTGATKVKHGEQEVQYNSRKDLLAELSRLNALREGKTGGAPMRVMTPLTGRGL